MTGSGVSLVLEGVLHAGVAAKDTGSLPAWVLIGRIGGVRGIWVVWVMAAVVLSVVRGVVRCGCHPSVIVWDWLIGVASRCTRVECSNHCCRGRLGYWGRLSPPPFPEWSVLLVFNLVSG